MKMKVMGALMAAGLLWQASPAAAVSYVQVNFSGQLSSGANIKAPFAGNGYSGGQEVSGSFVYDADLIPGPGYVNVAFEDLPKAELIPPDDAFSFKFGSKTFTLADQSPGMGLAYLQYMDGQFGGFSFVSEFLFQGQAYQFRVGGGLFSVLALDGTAAPGYPNGFPTGEQLVTGTLNIGNANLTNARPYALPAGPGVPEPQAWALMILGFASIGATLRQRRLAPSAM